LAFVVENPSALKVMRIDVDESLPVVLATNVGLAGGAWGPDGYIYLDGLKSSLVRVPETGGATEELRITDSAGVEHEINMPHPLPGGRALLVTVHRSQRLESWFVGVVDLTTMKVRSLMPGIAGYYLAPGRLLTVTLQGDLSLVPFDVSTMTVTGASTVLARGINLTDPWGVDLGVGNDALAYASAQAAKDSLQFGWVGVDGSFEPISSGWVDWLSSGALSPDGTRIAYTVRNAQGGDIWIRQLGNGATTRLSLGNQRSYRPAWSRDGKTVYYSRLTDSGHVLVSRPADASRGETVHARGSNYIYGARESVDSSTLVYANWDDTTLYDLWMLQAGDTAPKPLLVTGHSEFFPSLSPDGKWMTFTSDESGSNRVYVRPFPNVQETVWQVSEASGDFAQWSADGREIYYRSGGTIEAVEVVTAPTFALGAHRKVARLDRMAADPFTWGMRKDGRVLVLRWVSALPNLKIVVTQNLSAELAPLKQ
jgi:dipeptidyl aminopeptidase/acylaminoacyl peptidase